MYDKDLSNKWRVEIDFDEDETHTHATVRAQRADGETVTTLGDAYRNPKDGSQPMIGEEIAAARALIALGTDLLPYPEDHARDLGFVNVSASLGQLLGPLIGAGLVALVGGFQLMFVVGGALSIVGGLMTLAIRKRTPAPSVV